MRHTETGQESGIDTLSGSSLTALSEIADGVEPWNEGRCLGHEMGTIAEEDQHGKGVAENEFADTGDEEQDATEPYTGTGCGNTKTARTTPVHCAQSDNQNQYMIGERLTESNRERKEANTEAQQRDGSWVGKGGSKITSDSGLGTKIQSLESFWGQSHGVMQSILKLLMTERAVELVVAIDLMLVVWGSHCDRARIVFQGRESFEHLSREYKLDD